MNKWWKSLSDWLISIDPENKPLYDSKTKLLKREHLYLGHLNIETVYPEIGKLKI